MKQIEGQLNRPVTFTAAGLAAADAAIGSEREANRPLPARVEHRYRYQADRFSPRSEQAAVVDLLKEISEIKKLGETPDSKETLSQKIEQAFFNVPAKNQEGLNIPEAPEAGMPQSTFEDAQSARKTEEATLDSVHDAFLQLEGNSDEVLAKRQEQNLKAIIAYNNLIKINLWQAHWSLNNNKRIWTPSYLKAAQTNAYKLVNELNWRMRRSDNVSKKREIATLDYFGRSIWSVKLDALDINVGDEQTVIRRGLWLHPHSRVKSIVAQLVKDKKENEAKEIALDNINELLTLYPAENALFSTGSSKAIRVGLLELRELVNKDEDKSPLQAKAREVQKLIPQGHHHYIKRDIVHSKDSGSGKRSIIKTLMGNIKDTESVTEMLANTEHVAFILKLAASRQYLSKSVKDEIKSIISELYKSMCRGKVHEKTTARVRLEGIAERIESAYELQKSDKEAAAAELNKIAEILAHKQKKAEEMQAGREAIKDRGKVELIKTVAGLYENRLLVIPQIVKGTKKKLDALFIDSKDSDLSGSAARIVDLFKEGKYEDILKLISELNEFYLKYNSPEPGYQRAKESFVRIWQLASIAQEGKGKANAIEEIEELRDLIITDIEHKMSHRYSVLDLDKEPMQRKYVFAQANTTLANLPRQAGNKEYIRDPHDGKMKYYQTMGETEIGDASPITFQVSSVPATRSDKFIESRLIFDITKLPSLYRDESLSAFHVSLKDIIKRAKRNSNKSPGQARIVKSLEEIQRSIPSNKTTDKKRDDLRDLVKLIALDMDRKNDYRIAIIDRDEAKPHAKYIFVSPERIKESDFLHDIEKKYIGTKAESGANNPTGVRYKDETNLRLEDGRTYFVAAKKEIDSKQVIETHKAYIPGIL